MTDYDTVADGYDGHFGRPVDRWEDERLAGLLAPIVNGRDVLDLGCGTGWLLDHLAPRSYTGVDSSGAMLAVLQRKHPGADVIKLAVQPGTFWAGLLLQHARDVVTATWALQYLGDLPALLADCRELVRPGGTIALHGYLPRYARRRHEIMAGGLPPPCVHPGQARIAGRSAGLSAPRIAGTGALPDQLARSRRAWEAAARIVPARWHYAALWTWRVG